MNKETEALTQPIPFSQFAIHPAIADALAQLGWQYCTPIQAKTLPLTLSGHDVAGKAQTGTGKTAAFLVGIFNYLMTNPVKPEAEGPWAMILAPTRELASQIYQDALQIGCYTGLKPVAIYGGKDYDAQKAEFDHSQPDIIIGTPGRIIDLYKQRCFNLKSIECLVLDEADRMFDLGFISDIRYLMRGMPPAKERLNLIFSATFTYRVQELAYEYLNAPVMVEVASQTETAEHVEQRLYHVANNEKVPLLIGQLQQLKDSDKAIVFLNMKYALERLAHTLTHNGFNVAMLSGDIPQHKREKLLKAFQNGEKNILLATDVAARGLHIDDITHVFNYDLPQHPEDYIHRVGRTARAGKAGTAISLGCEDYAHHILEIEEKLGEKIPTALVSDDMLAAVAPVPKFVSEKRQNSNYDNNNRRDNGRNKARVTRSPYGRRRSNKS